MIRKYFPSAYADSVFAIDYEKLYRMGYRGVIFDIDGTLVPHGADADPAVIALFGEIHRAGLKTILLTNNDEERTRRFVRQLDTLWLCDAQKPAEAGYQTALRMLGMDRHEAICIGDQVFIDIAGANNSGIDSILVHYLLHDGETKLGVRRRLEKLILTLWRLDRRAAIGDITKEEYDVQG